MNTIRNEKGVALVLAMVMLVLMTILGVLALSTSTTEIGISGNYKMAQEIFYTADAAIERAQTDSAIYSTIVPGTCNSWPVCGGGSTTPWSISGNTANVSVDYLTSGSLPPGSGSDPEIFQAYYFLATTTASGANGSEYMVESQVARIVPK